MVNAGAVLAGHLHHVGHGADGGEGAVAGKEGVLPLSAQGEDQLEGHAHPGQVLEGVGAVGTPGVHHGHGVGQGVFTFVVVGDDQVQTDLTGVFGLLHAGDAAVHGDDQGDALVIEGAEGVAAQPVAVLHPAGDMLEALGSLGAQVVHQQHGGGDAVHIVVPEHGDAFPVRQGAADAGDGLVHIFHQEGGMGEILLPFQKRLPFLRGCCASCGQHGAQQFRVARFAQAGGSGFVVFPCRPSGVFHCAAPFRCQYHWRTALGEKGRDSVTIQIL